MVDTHVHLEMCDRPIDQLVDEAAVAGVRRTLTVGTDPISNLNAVEISESNSTVFASLGHHPHAASSYDDEAAAEIERLAQNENVRAIGETGHDFYRDLSPRADQDRAFISQIELARSLKKPLVIHTRSAAAETMQTLKEFAEDVTVIVHCFSATDHVDECVERGYYCSFAGNVTYPNANDLRAACSRIPDALLLVETDSPYLSPQKNRGKPNAPANVVDTAHCVAKERGQTYNELEEVVEKNAAAVFGW